MAGEKNNSANKPTIPSRIYGMLQEKFTFFSGGDATPPVPAAPVAANKTTVAPDSDPERFVVLLNMHNLM